MARLPVLINPTASDKTTGFRYGMLGSCYFTIYLLGDYMSQTKYMYTVSKGNPCVWWAGVPPEKHKLINQYIMFGIRWKEYDGELLLDYEELDKEDYE